MILTILHGAAFAWVMGCLTQFLIVLFLGIAYPKLTQVLVYFVLGPSLWIGSMGAITVPLIIFDVLPPAEASFYLVGKITFIPISIWTWSIATGLAYLNPKNWHKIGL